MVKLFPELRFFSKEKVLYRKTRRLYKDAGLKVMLHNLIRYKTCPFNKIRKLLPYKGQFLDLGCGYGFFSNLIAIENKERRVLGVDIDMDKIKIALTAAAGNPYIDFKNDDLSSPDFRLSSTYDCITLLDVLYLLPYPQQERVLKYCFDRLSLRGILILKEIRTRPLLKYIISVIQETISVKILRLTKARTGRFYFRAEESYAKLLKDIGFNINILRSDRGYLYPHIIFLARKSV